MRSALIAAVTALVVSTGTYAVADQGTDDAVRPVPAAATQAPAAKSVATGARRDVSGPCDEAEHANEPRCAGRRPAGRGRRRRFRRRRAWYRCSGRGPGHQRTL